MEDEFLEWYKENENRFHQGHLNEKEIAYSAWLEGQKAGQHETIVMWAKRLLFCPDYKFNFVDGELTSRECKICGKKEYPKYTDKGHLFW